jgi:protein TonB
MVIERIEEAKVYPFAARRNDIEGEVSVGFTILPDGKVNNIEVIPPRKCHKLLERAALDTIRKAAPYIPVPDSLTEGSGIRMKITIAFRMT